MVLTGIPPPSYQSAVERDITERPQNRLNFHRKKEEKKKKQTVLFVFLFVFRALRLHIKEIHLLILEHLPNRWETARNFSKVQKNLKVPFFAYPSPNNSMDGSTIQAL